MVNIDVVAMPFTAASEKGWLDHDGVMLEQVTSIKRAGADIIASYFAKDVVKLISQRLLEGNGYMARSCRHGAVSRVDRFILVANRL